MGLKYPVNHVINRCAAIQAFLVPFTKRQSGFGIILEGPRVNKHWLQFSYQLHEPPTKEPACLSFEARH